MRREKTQRSWVQLTDSNFPPLIHAFQSTTVMFHTIHIRVLIVEVAEKFLQQNKQFPNLVKLKSCEPVQLIQDPQCTSQQYLFNILVFYCEQEVYEYSTERFISDIVQKNARLGNVANESSNYGHSSTILVKIAYGIIEDRRKYNMWNFFS